MTFVDTPDWMSGVYTPQQLVGTFTGSDAVEVVTVPPNTESLLLLAPANTTQTLTSVVGVTSGETYPALGYSPFILHGESVIYVIPVAPALDTQYTVTWAAAPGSWFAIADAAVRTIIDPNIAALVQESGVVFGAKGIVVMGVNGSTTAEPIEVGVAGNQFVTPMAPGAAHADHPSTEVKYLPFNSGAAATLLVAPGAGLRYRLFIACLDAIGVAAGNPAIVTTVGGLTLYAAVVGGGGAIGRYQATFPLSGLPLDTNTAVTLQTTSSVVGFVGYTTETV